MLRPPTNRGRGVHGGNYPDAVVAVEAQTERDAQEHDDGGLALVLFLDLGLARSLLLSLGAGLWARGGG